MYLCTCVRGIEFDSFYGFSDVFWKGSDYVVFYVFHFITV